MGWDPGPSIGTVFFFLTIVCVCAAVVFVVVGHFLSYSRLMDWMGYFPSRAYWKFLRRKKARDFAILNIPPPPDGQRDEEVEALIKAGNLSGARELLQIRVEDARFAPVGGEAKLKRAVHYSALID